MDWNVTEDTSTLPDSQRCLDHLGIINTCSWWFITKAIILSLIVAAIIFGNSLVIASVLLYRKLRRSISNSFIASLALADFMLAVLVLPFSLSKELYGYWMFENIMCKIWLVGDVWVCTASILHLCAISLDRYIAIAYPLKYPNLMTNRRCRFICFAMWILSFIICFPALIQSTSTANDTDVIRETLNSSSEWNSTTTALLPPQCDVVNPSIGYSIYSALGSFFIPSFILIGFYIKIFLMARKFMAQARKGAILDGKGMGMRVHRGITSSHVSLNKNTMSLHEMSELMSVEKRDPAQSNGQNRHHKPQKSVDNEDFNRNNLDNSCSESTSSPAHSTLRKGSCKSENHLLPSLRRPKHSVGHSMNRETRAAKTVAIIVGVFILCWTPFFICYLVQGVSDLKINATLFNCFIWVGYINSLLNPCIYAYFSNDYRHAFKKILRCQFSKHRDGKTGLLTYITSYYISSTSDRTNSISVHRAHHTLNS